MDFDNLEAHPAPLRLRDWFLFKFSCEPTGWTLFLGPLLIIASVRGIHHHAGPWMKHDRRVLIYVGTWAE